MSDRGAGKRNDDDGAKEKLYTYASYVPVTTFKVRRAVVSFARLSTDL